MPRRGRPASTSTPEKVNSRKFCPIRSLRAQAIDPGSAAAGGRAACRATGLGCWRKATGISSRAFFACQYAGLVPAPLPLALRFRRQGNGYIDFPAPDDPGGGCRMRCSARKSCEEWLAETVDRAGSEMLGHHRGICRRCGAGAGSSALPQTGTGQSLAYLQFSSGSTRFPVGVAVTQRALMNNAHHMALIRAAGHAAGPRHHLAALLSRYGAGRLFPADADVLPVLRGYPADPGIRPPAAALAAADQPQ